MTTSRHTIPLPVRVACVVLGLAACTGGDTTSVSGADATAGATVLAADPNAVQLNDVSILFPLPAAAEVSELLAPSAAGARGMLLPSPLYDAIGHIDADVGGGGRNNASGGDYASLRVVAARIDPCFAALAPDPAGAECIPQLRLVLQSLTTNGGGTRALDSGLHLFYALTRDELLSLSREIVALRVASSSGERLGALQPHPIMAKQGPKGAMAIGVKALILKYAGQANLTRATEMNAHDQDFWEFVGFDVSDASAAAFTPMLIASLPARSVSQRFNKGRGRLTGTFAPSTTSVDDIAPLLSGGFQAQQAPLDALAKIDNPAKHSPNTIDCGSCHLATPTSLVVAQPLSLSELGDPFAFTPDPVAVLPIEMTPTFNGAGDLNVHAFSYLGADAGISRRTVNESAAIVAYINAAN